MDLCILNTSQMVVPFNPQGFHFWSFTTINVVECYYCYLGLSLYFIEELYLHVDFVFVSPLMQKVDYIQCTMFSGNA